MALDDVNAEIERYCKKYPRVPRNKFEQMIRNLYDVDGDNIIPFLAETFNLRSIYGTINDQYPDTPISRNVVKVNTALNKVLPSVSTDILKIVCEFGVMSLDDIRIEIDNIINHDLIGSDLIIDLHRYDDSDEGLKLTVYNSDRRKFISEVILTDIRASIHFVGGSVNVPFSPPDFKNISITMLKRVRSRNIDFVPIITHLICTWRSYMM